jgi:hypothetical protein
MAMQCMACGLAKLPDVGSVVWVSLRLLKLHWQQSGS